MPEPLFNSAPFIALSRYLMQNSAVVTSRERKQHLNACVRQIDRLGTDFESFRAMTASDPLLGETVRSSVSAWRQEDVSGLPLVNIHGMLRQIRNRLSCDRGAGDEDAIVRFTEAIRTTSTDRRWARYRETALVVP